MPEPQVKETVTPFFRFNARLGWPLEPMSSPPQIPYADRDLQLAIAGRSAIPLDEPFGTFGGRTLPRGLAISSRGRLFLADPDARLVLTGVVPDHRSPGLRLSPLWPARPLPDPSEPCAPEESAPRPADPYALVRPVAVALAPNGDLVIVDAGAARVLVLALPTARLRHVLDLAPGMPVDVAFDVGGRAHVADPVVGTVHRFDRGWRRDPDYPRTSLVAPDAVAATAPGAGGERCRCPGDCGELPPNRPRVHVLDNGSEVGLDETGQVVPGGEADLVLSPPPLVVTAEGLGWQDPALPGHEALLLPGVALNAQGRHRETLLPLLALPRRVEVPRSGVVTTRALDGGDTGFAWDRIAFEVTLPAAGRLVVTTLTSEVELARDRLEQIPPQRWSVPIVLGPGDVPEVLVQSPPGRYLWIRVELSGDGTVSPLISQLDVYGPRRSTLRHLPAPFHADPESAGFLDRYLSYFDTVHAEITAANRRIATLFDPQVVPAEFLAWLGSWFDLEFLSSWPVSVRREMIAEAVGYYRMRGTVAGLKRILQWHTGLADPLPQVIEHFRLPETGPVVVGGAALEPTSPAHSFTVVLPSHVAPPSALPVLERLVAANVPAHTRYELRLADPGVTVGAQSTVGVDMTLDSLGRAPLGGARLGATHATAPPEPDALVHHPMPLRPDGGPPC